MIKMEVMGNMIQEVQKMEITIIYIEHLQYEHIGECKLIGDW